MSFIETPVPQSHDRRYHIGTTLVAGDNGAICRVILRAAKNLEGKKTTAHNWEVRMRTGEVVGCGTAASFSDAENAVEIAIGALASFHSDRDQANIRRRRASRRW